MKIYLRNIEIKDLETLYKIENDKTLWKSSFQKSPFSKSTILDYINNSSVQDIYESKQKRFVISSDKINILGFIDIFNFDIINRRAGVGIVVLDSHRNKGIGLSSIKLLEIYCINKIKVHQLYATVDSKNTISIKLFEKSGFIRTGIKKDWNYYKGTFHDENIYQKILNE
ncbi:MAG: GNAT family N-acetyltransferase [Flavobacteriaceae bacterium]|nr:GNAT family N-acetyltransferase [Flavobacteriaceae bacterium]|tara:strand:+ start:14071 stop:14580 length:510 start_codon:yes stop_codon:yes gene_type:complete